MPNSNTPRAFIRRGCIFGGSIFNGMCKNKFVRFYLTWKGNGLPDFDEILQEGSSYADEGYTSRPKEREQLC